MTSKNHKSNKKINESIVKARNESLNFNLHIVINK